jgi:amino acid transporter
MENVQHQPGGLRRAIGLFGGLLLTLAVLSPSLGLFVIGNDMLHQAGSGSVACVVAAAILGVAVAAVFAELGSAFPHAGAEYTLAGRVLGPAAGFAMLSVNILGLPIGMAISGLGIADYLQAVLPGLGERDMAVPAIIAAVLIAARSIRLNATVTGLLVAAELAALLLTFGLGLSHARPDGLHRLLHPSMAQPAGGGLTDVPFSLLAVTSAAGIYALNGYGGVVCFGEEIESAAGRVGRVVYLALLIAAAAVILPLAAILAAAPDLGRLYRAPAPILGFLRDTGGGTVVTLVSLSVAGAIFNCMIALALTFGRVLFAAARDEAWPGPCNRLFARLSPRFGSPVAATIAFGVLALPLSFVPLKALILVDGNLNIAVYGTLALAVLAGRRSGRTAHSESAAWLHPLAPACVLVAMAALTLADLLDPQEGRPALEATAVIVAIGLAYAWWVASRNRRWRQRDACPGLESGVNISGE